MSKGSHFWANASGKLGEAVYYRAGGEQRTRTYVKNVKNPRSLAQMENRIQMLNLNVIYRSLKPILANSFTNKKNKESGWNAFVSANKSSKGAVVTKTAADAGLCVPYNVVIAKGNLYPTVTAEKVYSDTYEQKQRFVYGFKLPLEVDVTAESVRTPVGFENFLTAIGLPTNAKMTIVKGEYEDEGFRLSYKIFDSATIINATSSDIGLDTPDGQQRKTLTVLGKGDVSGETIIGVIFSHTDGNGKLNVSESVLKLADESDKSFVEQFLPDGEVYNDVLNTYGYNNSNVLSTK